MYNDTNIEIHLGLQMTPTPMPRIEIPMDTINQAINDGVNSAFTDPELQILMATVIAIFVGGAVLAATLKALGLRRP